TVSGVAGLPGDALDGIDWVGGKASQALSAVTGQPYVAATGNRQILPGVTVPDTPLITSALAFAKSHSTPTLYGHMVRSWLFGFIMASKIPSLTSRDLEAHSIAAILHDVGLDPSPSNPLVSDDKCFEVDSANAAIAFLTSEAPEHEWSKHRKQLVWDAIALHASIHIAMHKEPEVVATTIGIGADLMGPEGPFTRGLLTQDEYEGVVNAVPRLGMASEFGEAMCEICRRKPAACVGSVAEKWGEKYVEGFPPEGMKVIDRLEAGIKKLG
ncbi:MAG: hypothetical protein Q9168_008050, partial [Polycauliona sp. 1 TL-2023]